MLQINWGSFRHDAGHLLSHLSRGGLPDLTPRISPVKSAETSSPTTSYWEKVELIENREKSFRPQNFLSNQEHRDPRIVEAFGTATPGAGKFLLHYAPGWKKGSRPRPVLLVTGARHNANIWAEGPAQDGKTQGLAQYLSAQGFQVFALTFPHPHGDNFCWAQNIADAVKRIREITGAEKVDLVAHSKGGIAARAYVSSMSEEGMDRFNHDVQKLILLGTPNLGLDYPFRHPASNLAFWPEKEDPWFDAPMCWNRIKTHGLWEDCERLSLYTKGGNFFPGQAQLLSPFDSRYPLSTLELDWLTTYYGGEGFMSASKGIREAIREGGDFMAELNRRPADPGVQIAVLAGSKADIPFVHNEHTGPSDGIVFTTSSLHTDSITRGGAPLLKKTLLPLNHLELIYAKKAKEWILDALS